MMLRNKAIIIAFLMTGVAAMAQSTPGGDTSVVFINTLDLCTSYNVDRRIVEDTGNIETIMDSLRHVRPDSYPIMSQWCRTQQTRVNRMVKSLNEDYTREGNNIWMDSTHCISDAAEYLPILTFTAELLGSKSGEYDRLEQERLEAERKAAEERARAEALRIQREKDQRMAILKDTIKTLHQEITSTCDAQGITDKAKIKELKDIYYAYLAIYNKYDITDNSTSDRQFDILYELKGFQRELIDSVMGWNSLGVRIASFPDRLHARAGKEHSDVNKSYLRAFKKVYVPINFKSIAEFNSYTEQLRAIIDVQMSYLQVIDLRETINGNSNDLQMLCSKKHKDVYSSYKEILAELAVVPSYTTVPESEAFVANLNDFINIQHEYSEAVKRIDVIAQRGDSIVGICPKALSDMASAYKSLVATTDFVPRFINQTSADRYNEALDEFEAVQSIYVTSIGIRIAIENNATKITTCKNAPRGLSQGYKQLASYVEFTPHFNNTKSGNDYVKTLNHFIEIQEKFLSIIDENNKIENNTKQFKSAFKDYTNIYKSYERLLKTYDYDLNILSESDLNQYINHQANVTKMQERFASLTDSMEKDDYNKRLKKVKEPDKIMLIMGL